MWIDRSPPMEDKDAQPKDLTFAIATVNLWNRLNVAGQNPPGSADELLGLTKAGLS